ncbi:MAG: endonuclease/exonuclease/phosphatase family protein [Bacteroidales bacterium]|nr:endonuclease/exonuclease/phosphatase family protein [Bacteroidales bacterium]
MKSGTIKWRKYLRSVFSALITPFILALGIIHLNSLSAAWISPAQIPLPAVFGLIFPFTLAALIISMPILIIVKSRWIWIQLILIAISIPGMLNFIHFHQPVNEESTLSITTYNLHGYRGFNSKPEEMSPVIGINSYLADNSQDIICLQEFRAWSGNLEADIQSVKQMTGLKYHYTNMYWDKGGKQTDSYLIMSRYPIVNQGVVKAFNQRNIGVYADIVVSGQSIRVFSIHLASFGLEEDQIAMIGEAANMEMTKVKTHGRSLISRLTTHFELRYFEYEALVHLLSNYSGPVLVCGDFNETPASFIYRTMRNLGYADTHTQTGNYFGTTYGGKLPFLRIDYVFHSKDFIAITSEVDPLNWSDHYPLRVGVKLQTFD